MRKLTTSIILAVALPIIMTGAAQAQTPAPAAPLPPPGQDTTAGGLPVTYLPSPLPAPQKGQAPTMRVTELNPSKRSFQIVFSRGDEAIQGLAEFASQNRLNIAHLTAFGALQSARISWFEPDKRIYKTIDLSEPMEVTSFIGSIIRNATTGAYTVHVHGSVAIYRNGTVYSGHINEARIGPTMQVYLDDSAPLNPPPPAATAQAPANPG
jgi:predicted DNA-binding protein with PD1-like motif